MRCRWCEAQATLAIRSGFEEHPACEDCAAWWGPIRHGPLAGVEADYEYDCDVEAPFGRARS